jgi:hypothetical protein
VIGDIWWKPEGEASHGIFHGPGNYGISFDPATPPAEWHPVTVSPVFGFTETSNYDVRETDLTVGASDVMGFLHNEAWAAFSASEDYDYELQEQEYRDSIDDLIRSIIGKCVPRDFKLWQVRQFLTKKDAAVRKIVYHYKDTNANFDRTGALARAYRFIKQRLSKNSAATNNTDPAAITVTTAAREKVRLTLY